MEPVPSLDTSTGLQRGLKARHLRLIALGGVIGAGLFVGSGVVVQSAGPAAVLSFALTGAIVGELPTGAVAGIGIYFALPSAPAWRSSSRSRRLSPRSASG